MSTAVRYSPELRERAGRTVLERQDSYWVSGVNHLKTGGRWAFAEFTDVYGMQDDFKARLAREVAWRVRDSPVAEGAMNKADTIRCPQAHKARLTRFRGMSRQTFSIRGIHRGEVAHLSSKI